LRRVECGVAIASIQLSSEGLRPSARFRAKRYADPSVLMRPRAEAAELPRSTCAVEQVLKPNRHYCHSKGWVNMRSVLKALLVLLALTAIAAAIGLWYIVDSGVSAREQPGRAEQFLARRVRSMAIEGRAKSLTNPVARTDEVVAEGRAHFADHCAQCHGNDGSGNTEIGRGLWPKPADMRLAETQRLTDGELFWIIENGIRFTGMPAWGSGTKESETASWHLVHFIRHLPKLTPEELEEMESLNPKPPAEIRQQIAEEEFLKGGRSEPSPSPAAPHKHRGKHDE
jgi:mono/diheme cytochrome c family protein